MEPFGMMNRMRFMIRNCGSSQNRAVVLHPVQVKRMSKKIRLFVRLEGSPLVAVWITVGSRFNASEVKNESEPLYLL